MNDLIFDVGWSLFIAAALYFLFNFRFIKTANTLRKLYRNLNVFYFFLAFVFMVPVLEVYYYFEGTFSWPDDGWISTALETSFLLAVIFLLSKILLDWTVYRSFICPNCLKWVDPVRDWICPFCDREHKGISVFRKCKKCRDNLPGYSCPHCGYDIDFAVPYNEKGLKEKRNG